MTISEEKTTKSGANGTASTSPEAKILPEKAIRREHKPRKKTTTRKTSPSQDPHLSPLPKQSETQPEDLHAAVLKTFTDDFRSHGRTTIATVRDQEPLAYIRLCVGLLEKDSPASEISMDSLSDDQLRAHLHVRLAQLLAPATRKSEPPS